MPCECLEQDMQMMGPTGLNIICIAESTWNTEEPTPGCFGFSHVDRVINAAERHGIQVIVGTPTYAVPYWLVQMDPGVLVTTKDGKSRFCHRQNLDIANPTSVSSGRWSPTPQGEKTSSAVKSTTRPNTTVPALTLMGTDIYCFAQDRLMDQEFAFGGDLMRSLRQDNYLIAGEPNPGV